MPTEPSQSCPRCQRPLPANHAGGNCATCLLRSALRDDPEDVPDLPETQETPTEIGGFEILGELGRGGTGIVFKAFQRSVNRIVALKTLTGAALTRRDAFERLRIEAEAVGRLEHPHIVPLYEVGRHAGSPFLTLRYFEHGSLADALRRRRFTPQESARLIATAARAVHHAHQRGVLHRDIKPSNLLLDAEGLAHVADFGLAKLSGSDSELTLSTTVLGTPAYMAPEQADGRARQAGVPADVYGLGAILYELLTGRPPFQGGSTLEVLRRVADEEPARIRPAAPEVDADLEAICLRCLEKDPSARYDSAGALADDLDRWLNGETVVARPATWPGQVRRWIRRRPLVSALVLALVAGLASTLWQARVALAERESVLARDYRAALEFAENSIEAGNLSAARERLLQQPDRFRHVEWGRLMAKAHTIHRSVVVLTNDVADNEYSSVWGALSENGQWFAAGSEGELEVVNLPDSKVAFRLGSTLQPVPAADFDPAGRTLGVAGPGPGFRLFRCGTWEQIAIHDPTAQKPRSIHFHPEHDLLLTVAEDGPVTVRSSISGDVRFRLDPDPGHIFEWANFSRSGTRIFAQSRAADHGLQWTVWNTRDGSRVDTLPRPGFRFNGVEFNHDATAYAAVEPDGKAGAWIVGSDTPRFQSPIEGTPSWIRWAALSDDGTRMATLMPAPGRLAFWNLETGLRMPSSTQAARIVGRGGPNAALMSSANDWLIHLWDWSSGEVSASLPTDAIVNEGSLVRTRNGHWAGAVFRSTVGAPRVVVWGLPTVDRRFQGEYPVTSGATRPDGRQLATGSRDGTIALWDSVSGRREGFLPGHQWFVADLAWTPDGRSLFTSAADRRVHRWRMPEGRIERSFRGLEGPGWALAIQPDGSKVAASTRGQVCLWDGNTGSLLHRFNVSSNRYPWMLRFSPNGRWLAISGWIERGGVFDTASGDCVHRFLENASDKDRHQMCTAFSADGRRMASVRLDGWLEIRTVPSWNLTARARIRSLAASDLLFTPDGSRLVLQTMESSTGSGLHAFEVCDGHSGQSLAVLDRGEGSSWDLGYDPQRGILQRAVLGWVPALGGVEFHSVLPWRDAELRGLGQGDPAAGLQIAAATLREERWQQGRNRGPDLPEPEGPEDRSFWPQRDPATPNPCVDLTAAYNGHLDSGWIPANLYEESEDTLDALQPGVHELDGVQWDIRGVVTTGRVGREPFRRWRVGREVLNIPVGRHGKRLHFLHSAHFGDHAGELSGFYRLHYADGSTAELPLRSGVDIGEWWNGFLFSRCDAGSVAWEGETSWSKRHDHKVRLYHRAWDNPHPDREIVSMDLVAEGYAVVPFLVALTVEP